MQLQDFPPIDTKTTFEGYFQQLNRVKKAQLRNYIVDKTHSTYPTFYDWKRNNSWPILVKEKISDILCRSVNQLFPN